ncbi:MAG: hypothetical protein R3F56_12950 [Planctomycetota bacterium]
MSVSTSAVASVPDHSRPGRAWSRVASFLALAALGQLGLTVIAALGFQHELLRWDDVVMLWHDMQRHEGWSALVHLFEQQNEHRIVFPRLLFAADTAWCAASGQLMYGSLVLLQLLHVWVLAAIAWHGRRQPPAHRVAMVALVALMLFSCHQLENFVWRVQASSILVYLAASVAVLGLLACARNRACGRRIAARVCLGVSLGAGFVANFSRADGNLVWPILVLLAWALRLPRMHLVVLAAWGAACIASYFHGYETPPRGLPPWTVLRHYPGRVLAFVTAFLGAPATYFGVAATLVVGAIGLLLGATLLARAVAVWWRARRGGPPDGRPASDLGLLAVMAFAFGSAAVTGLGRGHGPLDGALVFRYATPALLYWAALLPLLAGGWAETPRASWARTSGLAAVVVFAGGVLAQQATAIDRHRHVARELEVATMALLTGVADIPALSAFNLPKPFLGEVVDFMRTQRLSVFRRGQHEQLGQPLLTHASPVTTSDLRGAITAVRALASPATGVEVRGWISVCPATSAPAPILLVAADTVVGFASCRFVERDAGGGLEWVGYARPGRDAAAELSAFALCDDDGRVAALPGRLEPPPLVDAADDSLAGAMARALLGPPRTFRDAFRAVTEPIRASIGLPLPAEVRAAATRVAGATTLVEAMPGTAGAMRLRGHVARGAVDAATGILVVDAAGRIVGAGRPNEPATTGASDVAWTAWAIVRDQGPVPQVLFVDAGGVRTLPLPPATPDVATASDDAPVIEAPLRSDGAWESASELAWFVPAPDDGPVVDSWAGSDRNQGTCRLGPIQLQPGQRFGLPVLIGPDAQGQTVRVVDVGSGEVLATLDSTAFRGAWRVWRVDVARQGARRVQVEATDRGVGYGQWCALGRLRWLP